MLRIREAIVVEGRYDKNTLSQLVDTLILTSCAVFTVTIWSIGAIPRP